MSTCNGLGGNPLENLNSRRVNRKPTYLALIFADILKESGWTPEDIHFLWVEIINKTGML